MHISPSKTITIDIPRQLKVSRSLEIQHPISITENLHSDSHDADIDKYSCYQCEKIYKASLFDSTPLKIKKCVVCNNLINNISLDFYIRKYKDEIIENKKKMIGLSIKGDNSEGERDKDRDNVGKETTNNKFKKINLPKQKLDKWSKYIPVKLPDVIGKKEEIKTEKKTPDPLSIGEIFKQQRKDLVDKFEKRKSLQIQNQTQIDPKEKETMTKTMSERVIPKVQKYPNIFQKKTRGSKLQSKSPENKKQEKIMNKYKIPKFDDLNKIPIRSKAFYSQKSSPLAKDANKIQKLYEPIIKTTRTEPNKIEDSKKKSTLFAHPLLRISSGKVGINNILTHFNFNSTLLIKLQINQFLKKFQNLKFLKLRKE
jgi:hypothetical protein